MIRNGTPEEYEEARKRAVEAGWDGVDEVTVVERDWDFGDIVTATFRPKRTDDLHPDTLPLVGKTIEWDYAWTNEDFEGNYPGQPVFTPKDRTLGWRWVPLEDLDIQEDR
jgi:hypothetical protein